MQQQDQPQQQVIGVNPDHPPYTPVIAPGQPTPYRGELDAEGQPIGRKKNFFRTWWSIFMCAFLMAQAIAMTQVDEMNYALLAAVLALLSLFCILIGTDKICFPALVAVMQATGGLMLALQGIRHMFDKAAADTILRKSDALTPADENTWKGLLILLRNSKYRNDVIAYLTIAGSALLTGLTAIVTVFRSAWHATNPGAF